MGKIESYVGFATRAKKIIYGTTLLSKARNIALVILCETGGKNARKDAENYARKHACPLIITKGEPLEHLVNKTGCKICGLTDKQMVKGIMAGIDKDKYEIINTGEEK
ncbi:MAG: hypothetical protein R3Y45_01830 [Bacillota bacterium]